MYIERNEHSTVYRERTVGPGAETVLRPRHSTSETPLRHSTGINALHNKSPALSRFQQNPPKHVTQDDANPGATFNAWTDVTSPHRNRSLAPRTAAAKSRRARSPSAIRPPAAPLEGGGAGQRPGLQGGGEKAAGRSVRGRGRPHAQRNLWAQR